MLYCAVCLIAKDENRYLREWTEYHLRLGFDAVILYDNESTIPLRNELADFAASGHVKIHPIESDPGGWVRTQGNAYTDCMLRYRDAFKWIAVIDADEFIFPKKTTNIKEFLAEFEPYGAVAANWVQFGSSGLDEAPDGSQIFSFIHAEDKDCTTIKSIVQPAKVKKFKGPHGALLVDGSLCVTSDHFPLGPEPYSAPFVNDVIQINHYNIRSWQDYQKKIQLKIWNNRSIPILSRDEEKQKYCRKNTDLLKFYTSLRSKVLPVDDSLPLPASVHELTEISLFLLQKENYSSLERYLCHASLIFEDEPMIWVMRAVSSRLQKNIDRALHCIRQASTLSASSTVYFELARIYQAMGVEEKSRRAAAQAEYKKYVEDTTCAPLCTTETFPVQVMPRSSHSMYHAAM